MCIEVGCARPDNVGLSACGESANGTRGREFQPVHHHLSFGFLFSTLLPHIHPHPLSLSLPIIVNLYPRISTRERLIPP
ncbi:hypothetical protein VTL71DRAFT_7168 [Oculimacula yallundae]|uniref:Uncharacterized protein n=1 Tax=Oculimacula yallundae TaxID=86028 RepID=A0ABR4BVY4_9HELO